MIIGLRARPFRGLLALLGLSVLAACWMDDGGPTGPALVEVDTRPVGLEMALVCEADLSDGTFACHAPEASLPTGGRGLVVGGQGELIELRSENVHYDAGQRLFQTDVSVRNLMMQALGTIDGETVSNLGVRVFYHRQPVATAGEGEITVLDVDGYDIFAASEQPYYQYGELLRTGEESSARTWKWRVPETVTAFEFAVFVFAPVQYPHGWIEIDREHLLLSPDETEWGLTAIARDAYGRPLADEVAWESSNPAVATIDSEGQVTPVGVGMAEFTASVEGRDEVPTASATIAVANESLLAEAVRLQSTSGGSRIVPALDSGLDSAIEASEAVTVEGWFRADYSSSPTLFAKGWTDPVSGGTVGFAVMVMSGGYLVAHHLTSDGPQETWSFSPLENGRWYHVALVQSAAEIQLYLDGQLILEPPMPVPSITLPDRFQLACADWQEPIGCVGAFSGDLDDVRVWGTALDGAMIGDWMDRPVTRSHPAFDDLLAYWPFDDGAGREAIDVSGRGAHATVEGREPSWISREHKLEVTPRFHYFQTADETLQLQVEIESALGEAPSPTFTSSDPSIATVDANGLVTAGEENGTAEIIVSAPGMPDAVVLVQKGPVYVKADATGANNGTSWEDAFVDLQDALNGPAGEVWVAKGTYKPAPTDDPDAVFQMRSRQAIYGGFDGTETSRDQRKWWANETVLDGKFSGSVWSKRVVLAEDVDSTGVLDGFTVTGAWTTGQAGAITIHGGAPTFRNLRVRNNSSGADAAGGVYLVGGAPTFYNVAITSNLGEALIATGGARPVLTNVSVLGSGDVSIIARGLSTLVTLRNAIVWYSTGGNLTVLRAEDGGILHVMHAFVEGGCPQFAICDEVHSINPQFVDLQNGDARLRAASVAIDKGRADFIPADAGELDLAGNPRVYGDAVDLGAYEVQSDPDWAPVGTLNRTEHDFGEVFRGHGSGWQGFQITNTGTGLLTIPTVEIVGDHAGDFTFGLNPCDGKALTSGESCAVQVEFVPQGSGHRVARLRFNHNGPGGYTEAELRGTVRSNIVYVNHAATGANDGTSWADAYTDLGEALDFMQSGAVEGIEVWVAQGVYKPTQGVDRSASFVISQNIAVYGGFNGTETSRDERKWWANPTVLSGDIGVEGDASDNSYSVVTLRNTNFAKVLDGLIITGGHNTRGGDDGSGGGIACIQCSATLRNVIVRDNHATNGGGIAGSGSYNLAELRVINSLITGNGASGDGGGIYARGGLRVRLENTTVYANHAGGTGGAASVRNFVEQTHFYAYNSIFWNNGADASDGIDEIHLTGVNVIVRYEVRNSVVTTGCTGLDSCDSTVVAGDPLFVDPLGPDGIAGTADDDLRLLPGSSAIGRGDLSHLSASDRIHDLLGQPRVVGTLDAGAIERQEP